MIKLFIPCLANQLPSFAGNIQHRTQHTSFSITSNKIQRSVFAYVGEIQDLWDKEVRLDGVIVSLAHGIGRIGLRFCSVAMDMRTCWSSSSQGLHLVT